MLLKSHAAISWLYVATLFLAPVAVAAVDMPVAHAQVRREPTSALGQKIGNKADEVNAIAIKVGLGLLGFYAVFVAVKFISGNGREGWQHLLYLALGATMLAAIDQVIAWSQG